MFCIKVDIPAAICDIDDELKVIYHSNDPMFVFKAHEDRNKFMDKTVGMKKQARE